MRLFATPGGAHDGRLVAVYSDANSHYPIWNPLTGQQLPRDIFVRYSDDDGATWSAPVNVSNTAGAYSKSTDQDGDGTLEPYWGDSGQPSAFASGDNVVVSWTDKYCPEVTWTFGTSGQSTVQGSITYPYPVVGPCREVPFAGVYVAVSSDGGTTWTYGGTHPPLQLTYGRRDAGHDQNFGSDSSWAITWQEDPLGLQSTDVDASGGKVSKGTDVWYAYTTDIASDALALRTNRTPISDQTVYDVTGTNGFVVVGLPGSRADHGSSRAGMVLVPVGTELFAAVAYEETLGHPAVVSEKTIQYHSFRFDRPYRMGPATFRNGGTGAVLTDPFEDAREVQLVAQSETGINPAVTLFWRQGLDLDSGLADIMLKASSSVDVAAVVAAPTLNISSNTPKATTSNLLDSTGARPLENAMAHHAVVVGESLAIGYVYTSDGALAHSTDLVNYNYWMRRSLDRGLTWFTPQNLSGIEDTTVNAVGPQLVGPADTGTQDPNVLVAAWGTERNVYAGTAEPYALDVFSTESADFGNTFSKVVRLCASDLEDYGGQILVNDDGSEVYSALLQTNPAFGTTEACFTLGTNLWVPASVGTLFCFGDGSGAPCPCGNPSPVFGGCANSMGAGVQLVAGGSVSLASKNLSLEAVGVPPNQPALLVSSPETLAAALGFELGDGLLCLGPPVQRLEVRQTGATGVAVWAQGFASKVGYLPGETHFFQVWYRDPIASPCGSFVNFSNGVEVTFVP